MEVKFELEENVANYISAPFNKMQSCGTDLGYERQSSCVAFVFPDKIRFVIPRYGLTDNVKR